jgi:hypothetical protein
MQVETSAALPQWKETLHPVAENSLAEWKCNQPALGYLNLLLQTKPLTLPVIS